MIDRPQMIHSTWDDGQRFRCICGWSSIIMWSEASRAMALSQREQHDIKPSDSDGEAAHAALADFWHPNNPAANADMSMRVTRAISEARQKEHERCASLVRAWIEDLGLALLDRPVDALKAILHDIENSE